MNNIDEFNRLRGAMPWVISGIADATSTESKDWSVYYPYAPDNKEGRDVWATARVTYRGGGVIYINGKDGAATASLPTFKYISAHSFSDIIPYNDKENCKYDMDPRAGFNPVRLQTNPCSVGKAIGKKVGVSVINLWKYVIQKQKEELDRDNRFESTKELFKERGWVVRDAPTGIAWASKKDCPDIKIEQNGSTRFYYQHQSFDPERMERAARILGGVE